MIELYSDLERDHWLLIEADPDIITFCEQPCYASAVIDGSLRRSIPDMWIRRQNGTEEFIEIKYLSDLVRQREEKSYQIKIQSEWAKHNNVAHKVVTDVDIRGNLLKLANISKMIHAIRVEMSNTDAEIIRIKTLKIVGFLKKSGGSLKIGELLKATSPMIGHEANSIIYCAILSGQLYAPFENALLTLEMTVTLPTEKIVQ